MESDRFQNLSPEKPAMLPKGYSAPLKPRPPWALKDEADKVRWPPSTAEGLWRS